MVMIKGIIEKKMILHSTRRTNGWQFGYRGKTGIGDWHCYFQIKTGNYHAEWGKKNHKIWKYIGWKVKMRFFRTALVTSKFSDSLDQCWRGCASWKSAHTYFGTACAKLSGYWQKKKKVPLTIILLFERNITRRYSIEDNNQTLLMRVVRLIAKKTKARIFSVFMD